MNEISTNTAQNITETPILDMHCYQQCFLSDNLEYMKSLPDNHIDLIYCDILYGTGRNFTDYQDLKPVKSIIEEHYIPRIKEMHRILKDTGSIYLHMDTRINHWVRCILDDIFGYGNFRNEIIWQKIRTTKTQSTSFGNIHDSILIYSKGKNPIFNQLFSDINYKKLKIHYNKVDEKGRVYQPVSFTQDGQGKPRYFGERGLLSPPVGKHWIWSQDRINEGIANGLIEFSENGNPKKRMFLDDVKGTAVGDIWGDIFPLNSVSNERLDYPTQKPKALIERIIKASSNEGDLVADFYVGSGTTAEVCKELNRNFVGCDISPKAIQITNKRLSATLF